MSYYGKLSVRKHKCGKWQGILHYHPAEGKRRSTSKLSNEKGKRAATAELEEWRNRLEEEAQKTGRVSTKDKKNGPTVEDMITDYLNHQLETGKIEKSTYGVQLNNAKSRVFPYIGSYIFEDLDLVSIEAWVTELYKCGLKSNTIQTIYAIPSKVYRHNHKIGKIAINPFEFVETPTKGGTKVTHLTQEGMDKLLEAIDDEFPLGSQMRSVVFLALYAGLRRGEICALRWNDVDFRANTITVRSAIGVFQGTYTKGPKNRSSYRTFPMVKMLRKELEHRQSQIREAYGTVNDGWFVVGDTIHYLSPTSLSRRFKAFIDKYGIVDAYGKPITPHGLRHNYATVGIRSKMDIASLSLMMGHASRAMTLDTYGDANADALLVASDKLSNQFRIEQEGEIQEDQ